MSIVGVSAPGAGILILRKFRKKAPWSIFIRRVASKTVEISNSKILTKFYKIFDKVSEIFEVRKRIKVPKNFKVRKNF